MIKNALIKYSLIFICLFPFCSCKKKLNIEIPNRTNQIINLNQQSKYILKGNDTISISRKYGDYKSKMIDSVFLKIHDKTLLLKFPLIATYEIDLKKDIPKNKEYNYSNDDFLITATYRDFQIQYKFDYKLFKLKNIYLVKNIDEVYPDFNKKPSDSIAKIDVLNFPKSEHLQHFLNKLENDIYNQKIKPDNTFYILRKGNLKEIL